MKNKPFAILAYRHCKDIFGSQTKKKLTSKCMFCEFQIPKGSLTVLIKEFHPEEKIEKCGRCKYETFQLDNLKVHIRNTHDGEYKTCNYCKNDYKYLDNHIIQSHFAEAVKFNCDICDYFSVGQGRLDSHIQRNHKLECYIQRQHTKKKCIILDPN